jgi:hypothetical protein
MIRLLELAQTRISLIQSHQYSSAFRGNSDNHHKLHVHQLFEKQIAKQQFHISSSASRRLTGTRLKRKRYTRER